MTARKDERVLEALKNIAAEFLGRESNRRSLITVTGVRASKEFGLVTILVTVFPTEREEEALGFLKRQRGALREYAQEHLRREHLPTLDFALDAGEKHRQIIDTIDTA